MWLFVSAFKWQLAGQYLYTTVRQMICRLKIADYAPGGRKITSGQASGASY